MKCKKIVSPYKTWLQNNLSDGYVSSSTLGEQIILWSMKAVLLTYDYRINSLKTFQLAALKINIELEIVLFLEISALSRELDILQNHQCVWFLFLLSFPGAGWQHPLGICPREHRGPRELVTFQEAPFKSSGAGNPTTPQVKLMGWKTNLAEQGTLPETRLEKGNTRSLEARSVFIGRLWSFGFHLQGENDKTQSPAWVATGQCGVRQQKKTFSSISTTIGLILGVEGHLMRKEEEKTEEFNSFSFFFFLFFSSYLTVLTDLGLTTGGVRLEKRWPSICIYKRTTSAQCAIGLDGIHPWSTEGVSSCYSWMPFNNLPKVMKACAGPCWLENSQCHNHVQKWHEWRPRKLQTC